MKTTTLFSRSRLSASVASAVLGLAIVSTPAFAQTAADEAAPGAEDTIVVTGSRIARADLELSSPVTVVSAAQLQLSGTTNAEEFLRDLPQAVSAIGSNSNNGNPGVATVDLRNLGEARTLVLVDGKRFIPYDSNGFVDVNAIPASLIERIEVLTGGASSVYGSDAVAGVVNFIFKRNFEGLEADAQYGLTQRGDGTSRSFALTVGVNSGDGRGNITFNANYTKVDAVNQGQRDYSRTTLAAEDLSPSGGSSTNAFGAIDGLVALGGRGQFDATGNLVPFVGARDGFNFNPFNLLQVPQDKWTATAVGHYDITDAIEFYGRASFANSRVSTIIAPSGTFGFPFSINYATNPFLNAQARGILGQNDTAAAGDTTPGNGFVTVPLRRRTVELGTRDSIYENTYYQLVGGLKGAVVEGVKWEAFAQYGRTSRTITFANDLAFATTQQALLAVRGPNNTIVCSDPSGGCSPANLFGAGNLSQAAGNFIRVDLQQVDQTSQLVAGGFLSADLPFKLVSDKAGALVVGVEYRRELSTARPDNNLITGNSVGFGSSTPINARLSTKEIYGELNLPIVTDRPFVKSLSIEAGIRYADYSNRDNLQGLGNSFKTTSYKIGGEWSPTPDFKIRGGFNRAVRAPNLNEIGQPFTPGTGAANFDHCESIARGQPITLTPAVVNNPNRSAAATQLLNLCVATGTPLAALQGGLVDGVVAGQINNFAGGNIRLTPERADTITVGATFTPTFLKGFTGSVDYFDIKVRNGIFQVPEQETLIACYEVERVATSFNCSRIRRNPITGSLSGGTETGVVSTNVNIGGLRNRGVDIAANYAFDIANDVKLTLGINATYTLDSQLDYGSVTRECVGLVGQSCLRLLPELQWIQSTSVKFGPATVQLRWQHIGKITQDQIAFGFQPASAYAVPSISARDYFDLYSNLDVSDRVTFRFGVNNLLDKSPPLVGNDYGGTASGNTFPQTYEPLGRSFFIGANVRF
ncbi:MAG: TonB-dependent receptor plug domain-containing protein [Sphingomonadaceae bacterium]